MNLVDTLLKAVVITELSEEVYNTVQQTHAWFGPTMTGCP